MDIYKDSILDAKKLREAAEAEAKNKIMEKISPYIKKMIKADQLSESYILEQDEQELDPATQQDQTQQAHEVNPTQSDDEFNLDTSLDDGGEDLDAPIDPEVEDALEDPELDVAEDIVDASLPDDEGLITVDFNDLFQAASDNDTEVNLNVDVSASPQGTQATASATSGTENAISGVDDIDSVGEGEGDDFDLDMDDEDLDLSLGESKKSYAKFKNRLNEAHSAVDRIYYSKKVTNITKESMRNKLFNLVEQLDRLVENGAISPRQAKLNEKRLEFLYLKLKESGKNSNYTKVSEDNTDMKLKKIAARLFEGESLAKDSLSTGETGLYTDDEASEHAAEESGMSPELSDFLREFSTDAIDYLEEDPWEDGDALIDEDEQADYVTENAANANTDANGDIALGAAGFGDTDEDPDVDFEVTGLKISEAAKRRRLRKEAIRRKFNKLKEACEDSWEDGDPEGGFDPTHSNLKENDEMDFEDDDFEIDGEGGLTIKLDLPDEVEDVLASLGDADITADVELDLGGDDSFEDDFDGEDFEGEDFGGEGEEEIILVDDESASVSEARRRRIREARKKARVREAIRRRRAGRGSRNLGESRSARLRRAKALAEARARRRGRSTGKLAEARARALRARKLRESALMRKARRANVAESYLRKASGTMKKQVRENAILKKNLQEANLFTAKNVYLNKLMMREGLSKSTLRTIVAHLDRAKTIAEARTIYNRINARLNEASTKRKVTSSSRVTRRPAGSLSESRRPVRRSNGGEINLQRWKKIAGINK